MTQQYRALHIRGAFRLGTYDVGLSQAVMKYRPTVVC